MLGEGRPRLVLADQPTPEQVLVAGHHRSHPKADVLERVEGVHIPTQAKAASGVGVLADALEDRRVHHVAVLGRGAESRVLQQAAMEHEGAGRIVATCDLQLGQ